MPIDVKKNSVTLTVGCETFRATVDEDGRLIIGEYRSPTRGYSSGWAVYPDEFVEFAERAAELKGVAFKEREPG